MVLNHSINGNSKFNIVVLHKLPIAIIKSMNCDGKCTYGKRLAPRSNDRLDKKNPKPAPQSPKTLNLKPAPETPNPDTLTLKNPRALTKHP